MSEFTSILLPLDGSSEAAKGAGCALWLAERLGATLHVLHATGEPLPASDALARLRLPDARRAQVVVHQLPDNAQAAVLDAIAAHAVDLVVMSARGESASAGLELHQRVGSVAHAVIERSPVPVLLLPARYREALPWTSMVAAASGEAAADQALETAVRLAGTLRLEVTVVHCADGGTALGAYADAPHHEYARRLDEMVERGLSGCPAEARNRIADVTVGRGDPAAALLAEAARHDSSVLALGWHGALSSGRAPVLKRLLDQAECPLLLVQASERSSVRLKVGAEIDEG